MTILLTCLVAIAFVSVVVFMLVPAEYVYIPAIIMTVATVMMVVLGILKFNHPS